MLIRWKQRTLWKKFFNLLQAGTKGSSPSSLLYFNLFLSWLEKRFAIGRVSTFLLRRFDKSPLWYYVRSWNHKAAKAHLKRELDESYAPCTICIVYAIAEIALGIVALLRLARSLISTGITDSGNSNWSGSFYRRRPVNTSTRLVPLNWILSCLNSLDSRYPSRIKKNKRGNNQAVRCPYILPSTLLATVLILTVE